MYKLTDFLGLKGASARAFLREIDLLEAKIASGGSVSARIVAEIYQDSHKITRELGFLDGDVLAEEAFSALKNKLLGDQIVEGSDDFWRKNRAKLILASDGIVSVNSRDLSQNISAKNQVFDNFIGEFQAEIAQKFHQKLPQYSTEKIKQKLFKGEK